MWMVEKVSGREYKNGKMNITVIGLGLIGCSMAIDLKKSWPKSTIIGVDINSHHAKEALESGYIDEIHSLNEALKISDIIILALPVNAIQNILRAVLSGIKKSALVMDVGSTKKNICQSVARHPQRKNFVACHPMAGTENSGPGAALPKLFCNKVVVICQKNKSADWALKTALQIFKRLGMRIVFMDAARHDVHVAYISHVSHVVSYVLAITVLKKEKNTKAIFDLASSGFQSTVRLAKSHPDMWTPILLENAENINKVLADYSHNLNTFREALESKNPKKVTKLIGNANKIRKVLR